MRQVGTIGIANKINLNRRLYTRESLDSLREQIEGNRIIYSDQEAQAPIGRVEKVFWEGNKLKVLVDLPPDKINLYCNLAVMGTLIPKEYYYEVQNTVKLRYPYVDTTSSFGTDCRLRCYTDNSYCLE